MGNGGGIHLVVCPQQWQLRPYVKKHIEPLQLVGDCILNENSINMINGGTQDVCCTVADRR